MTVTTSLKKRIRRAPSLPATHSFDAPSERMGFPDQAHGDARASLECTTSLAAPCGRKGWSRETGLAFISPLLFDPAQRVWDRHQGATGTSTACGHSHDDEHLHQSGTCASPRSKQQGRPASFAYRHVRHPLCVPFCSLVRTQVIRGKAVMAEACGSRTHHPPREGTDRRL